MRTSHAADYGTWSTMEMQIRNDFVSSLLMFPMRLRPMKVLSVADDLALELTAEALAEVWRYEQVVRERGATYETLTREGSTMVRQRPEVLLLSTAWQRAMAGLREFGLSPRSLAPYR
jgi:Phage terminase, small subunit